MSKQDELLAEVQKLKDTIDAEQLQIQELLAQNAQLIEEKNALIASLNANIESLDAVILNLQEQLANGVTPDALSFIIGELKTASSDIASTVPPVTTEGGEGEGEGEGESGGQDGDTGEAGITQQS